MRLQPIPRNPERTDYHTRHLFRVWHGQRPVCHLVTGENMTVLWQTARAFAKACPTLAAKPLFLQRTRDQDYLAFEFIEGPSLESALRSGQINVGKAKDLISQALAALNKTRRPSHGSAAEIELQSFCSQVERCPVFGSADRGILRDIVFPLLQQATLEKSISRRWTNGDFIARNLLVDPEGNPRLIDYEFARQTHFHLEDVWRWGQYSDVPSELRVLNGSIAPSPLPVWVEAFGLLRQIVLEHQINGPSVTLAGLPEKLRLLLDLAARENRQFRASVFLGQRNTIPAALPGPSATEQTRAQLFWSQDGEFDEVRSVHATLRDEDTSVLHFRWRAEPGVLHLRLDPCEIPALVEVKRIAIRDRDGVTVRAAFPAADGWDSVRIEGDAFRVPDVRALRIIVHAGDPNIRLPVIDLEAESQDLVADVEISLSSKFSTLATWLRQWKQATEENSVEGQPAALRVFGQSRASEGDSASLREGLNAATAHAQRLEAELATRRVEAETALARLAEIEKLEAQLDEHRESDRRKTQELEDAMVRAKGAENSLATLSAHAAKSTEFQQQLCSAQVATERAHAQLQARERELTREIREVSAAATEAQQQVERLNTEMGKVHAHVQYVENLRAQENRRASDLERQVAEGLEARARLEREHIDLAAAVDSLTQERKSEAIQRETIEQERVTVVRDLEASLAQVNEWKARSHAESERAARLEHSVDEAQRAIEVLQKEKVVLVQRFEEAISTHARQLTEAHSRVEEIQRVRDSLNEEVQKLIGHAGHLEHLRRVEVEAVRAEAAAQMQVTVADLELASRNLAETLAEVSALRGQLDARDTELTVRGNTLRASEQEKARLEALVDAGQAEINVLSDRLNKASIALRQQMTEAAQANADHDRAIAHAQEEREVIEAQLQARTRDLAQALAQIDKEIEAAKELRGHLDNTSRELAIRGQELVATQQAHENASSQLQARNIELEAISLRLFETEAAALKLQKEAEARDSALDARDATIGQLQRERERVASELEIRNSAFIALEAELRRLQDRFAIQQQALEVASGELKISAQNALELGAQCAARERVREDLENHLRKANDDLEGLRMVLADEKQRKASEIAGLRAQKQDLETVSLRTANRLDQLSREIETSCAVRIALETRLEVAKQKLSDLQEQHVAEMAMNRAEVSTLRGNFEDLLRELAALREKTRHTEAAWMTEQSDRIATEGREAALSERLATVEQAFAAIQGEGRQLAVQLSQLQGTHQTARKDWERERSALETALREQGLHYESERDALQLQLSTMQENLGRVENDVLAQQAASAQMHDAFTALEATVPVRIFRSLRLISAKKT